MLSESSKVRSAVSHSLDPWFLVPVVILTAIGILIVYTSSFYISARFANTFGHFYFVTRHLMNISIGLILMIFLSAYPSEKLLKAARPILVAAIVLLIGLLIFGKTIAGVKRWIRIVGFSFQPSEFAKFAIILYTADYIARKKAISDFKRDFLPILTAISLATILIALQPNLSMAVLIFSIGAFMLFVGNTRLRFLVITGFLGIVAFVIFIKFLPYAHQRIAHFLAKDVMQVRHGLAGMASGGLFGKGPGKGVMKFLYLPAPFTDFIFAVIGEEFGFIGTSFVTLLFLVILLRGYHIAAEIVHFGPSYLGHAMLAIGFSTAIALFAFVNISIVLGKLPPTGVPLPFITYGGSAALFNFSAIGVLLSISSTLNRLKAERRLL